MPYFTIVIPTFNRGHLLDRALRSCLAQNLGDWEAVVVDDASNDPAAIDSGDVVARIGDPRVRLIRQEQNRGVCEARNTGSLAAQGSWLVFLDDDDELVPGALTLIHGIAERSGPEVHRLIFAYVDDAGGTSPQPALHGGAVWDYRQYLEWVEEASERTDFMNCIHRDVFKSVLWPRDRSREDIFHFDLARRFRTECHSDVVAIIHTDAANRFTDVPGYERVLRMAPDLARQMIPILDQHGEALRRWAPRTFARFLRHAAINHYLAGNRKGGLRYSAALLRRRPFAPSAWGVLFFGLLSPRVLAAGVAVAKRRRSERLRYALSSLRPAVK
jgi:glycosyltransferase involved in cell wall biosynthesis